jgi:hypothetical protein
MAVIKFETRLAGPPLLINPAVRHTTDQQPMSIEATPITPTPTLPFPTLTVSRETLCSLVIAVAFFIVSPFYVAETVRCLFNYCVICL